MATYTGVADANGDFTVSFGSDAYTGGQKVIVTAERDSATKSIELHAPSSVVGGGTIQFSGSLDNFPENIGVVTISGLTGTIGGQAFFSSGGGAFFAHALGLVVGDGVTSMLPQSFDGWSIAESLNLPTTLTSIGNYAFQNWYALKAIDIPDSVITIGNYAFNNATSGSALSLTIGSRCTTIGQEAFWNQQLLTNADIGASVTTMGQWACGNWTSCNQIIMRSITPPTIQANTFSSLKSTCIIKVPAASVAAYQAAPNWSAFASRIQAI